MKINISIIIILMLNPLIIGNDEANAEKENERYNQAIIKVLPEEFKNYKKQLKGDNRLNDAKVSLSLISKTQDLILKSTYNTDPNKQEEYNKAYIATWRLCTVMMRKTTDSEAKKLILEKWTRPYLAYPQWRTNSMSWACNVHQCSFSNAWFRNGGNSILLGKSRWYLYL